MFSCLGSHGKDASDPLTSGRATSVWLKQLPALDVLGRVTRARGAVRGRGALLLAVRANVLSWLRDPNAQAVIDEAEGVGAFDDPEVAGVLAKARAYRHYIERDLDDDYYEFDEKNYCLRGRRKNRIYSLGDAITVKVARANLEKKQLDFALVE